MIVLVCFNSFLPILDFLAFCTPVYAVRKFRKNHPNSSGFWQNLEIPDTFQRFYIDPKKERKRRGRGAIPKSKKIKIFKNKLKHPQTIIECHIKWFRVRPIGLWHHITAPEKKHAFLHSDRFENELKQKKLFFFEKNQLCLKSMYVF